MPAAVAVPAIASVASSLGGAALASRSAGKAAKYQEQATRDALNFEREREANRRAEYGQMMEAQKQQWLAKERMRVALLRRYGVDVPDPSADQAPVGGAPAQAGAPKLAGGPGLTLGQMMAGPSQQRTPLYAEPEEEVAPIDMRNWSNWSR